MFQPADWIKDYDASAFERQALALFDFQYWHNEVYRRFAGLLGRTPQTVKRLTDIPFMPVEFFKAHQVVAAPPPYDLVFQSSGTTGMVRSRHYVKDRRFYERAFLEGFRRFYGEPSDWVILALLPSYLEREGSSLVYMVQRLIEWSGSPHSGFYLHNYDELYEVLQRLESSGQRTLLLGVSFALLDLAERYSMQLRHTVVMETGGMKGRRREPVREELHAFFKERFGVDRIHSEYGMTELLSQAYSRGEGRFETPPWMKVLIRDPEDPLSYMAAGRTGGINIIDLANVYSCAFLATQDLGRMHEDGRFEVLGRFDNSDIRGCNLLIVED